MIGKKKLFVLLTATILLTACQPDPRREAAAYATTTEADARAAAEYQRQSEQADLHAIEMEREQIKNETLQSTKATKQWGWNLWLQVTFLFGTAGTAYAVFETARTYKVVVNGVGDAMVISAQLRANLIPLDVRTRQFPLLRHVHGDKWVLVNPNDGGVRRLDLAHEPDRQMIAGMTAVQYVGVLATAAKDAQDAAGVAMIQPTVIDAQEGKVNVGANLFEALKETSLFVAGGQHEQV